jgi:hypothetical protein
VREERMISSVPITLRGEAYHLLFTPRDVDDIETSRNMPLCLLMADQGMILRVGVIAELLFYGLKVPGKFGPHGEPIRALPQDASGRALALQLVQEYTSGKSFTVMSELGNLMFRAFAAGEWFNLKKISETVIAGADTSVPQEEKTPPKNSEGPG